MGTENDYYILADNVLFDDHAAFPTLNTDQTF